MGVRKTVFGSSLERSCFRKLSETWGKDYHVYHNLPFLSVFMGRTELLGPEMEVFKLSDEKYEHLKKTSIDALAGMAPDTVSSSPEKEL